MSSPETGPTSLTGSPALYHGIQRGFGSAASTTPSSITSASTCSQQPFNSIHSTHGHSRTTSISSVASTSNPIDSAFYSGTPAQSNEQTLYIRVPSAGNEGNAEGHVVPLDESNKNRNTEDFWVTVPWQAIGHKMLEQPTLLLDLLESVKATPVMKNRILRMLAASSNEVCPDSGYIGAHEQGDFNLPSSPNPMRASNMSLFPPMPMPDVSASTWSTPGYPNPSEYHSSAPVRVKCTLL